jgi:molybdopterin-guanine dinucleotide biosynthesis protein A
MGTAKAELTWKSETFLQRVVGILSQNLGSVVLVHGPNQLYSSIPSEVLRLTDIRPDAGPVAGLETALAALESSADAIYLSSCDVPLLSSVWLQQVRHLWDELDPTYDALIPEVQGRLQPLAACYRTRVKACVSLHLDQGRRGMLDFLNTLKCRVIAESELKDPACLRNINTPQDYHNLLAESEKRFPTSDC